MTVVLAIGAAVAFMVGLLIELMDWGGRLDYLRANYPRVAAILEKRAVRTILLLVIALLVARDLYEREAVMAKTRRVDETRAGLIPFAEEGQKMIPNCLTLPQATIDEWANKVLAFLRSKGDTARAVRFTNEAGIGPHLPDAAIHGYTAEQVFKCSHFNARLVRLNEFLRGE